MRILGLFAKQPLPGQVKTRLAAETSTSFAAMVGEAFLHDMVARLATFDAHRVLAFAPHQAESYFTQLVQGRFQCLPQSEGHLGARMAAFFTNQMKTGTEQAVLIGTDSPTMPIAWIEQAFAALEQADVVLGPATDGGYYLVGCARRVPPIFECSSWSHERVLAEAVACLHDPAWRLALLSPWYDVDTLADWRMLKGHVTALRRAGLDPEIPRTEKLLLEGDYG